MKILGSEVLWCFLGHWFKMGYHPYGGIIWGSVPAKFKIEMYEMKILGSEVLWCILGYWFKMGWHTCGV